MFASGSASKGIQFGRLNGNHGVGIVAVIKIVKYVACKGIRCSVKRIVTCQVCTDLGYAQSNGWSSPEQKVMEMEECLSTAHTSCSVDFFAKMQALYQPSKNPVGSFTNDISKQEAVVRLWYEATKVAASTA